MYLIRLVKYHVSSSSTPLSYNINEKKTKNKTKPIPGRGPRLCGVCTLSSWLRGLPLVLQFPPSSQRCAHEVDWPVCNPPGLSEWTVDTSGPALEGCPAQGGTCPAP